MPVQQIARGVYRISFPTPVDKPARGAQYRSNFSQEKHKQWLLAIEQAKLEISDVQARNKYARSAAENARDAIDKEISAIRNQTANLRDGVVKSQESSDQFNSRSIQKRREFNASQSAQRERAQAQLDLSRERAAATSARASAKSSLNNEFVENSDLILAGSGGNMDLAWDKSKRGAESGLIKGGDVALDQYAFVNYDRALQTNRDNAVSSKGAPLSAAEEAQITTQTKSAMPADMMARADDYLSKHTPEKGTGVDGESTELRGFGVGEQPKVTPVSREAELQELADRLAALQQKRSGITAEQRDVPNLIRTAQQAQFEGFGPIGLGRRAPGFQQQEVLRNVEAFMDTSIQSEIGKLEPGFEPGELDLARTRGIQNAIRMLGGTVGRDGQPEPEVARPVLAPSVPAPQEEPAPIVRTPEQRAFAYNVESARQAQRMHNEWKKNPRKIEFVFTHDPRGKAVAALYDANKSLGDGELDFDDIFGKVATEYEDDEENRDFALQLLLTYNMMRKEKETPKVGE